jgi:hypothetical protein
VSNPVIAAEDCACLVIILDQRSCRTWPALA